MGEVIDFKTRQKVKLKNEKMSKKQQDEGLRAYANSMVDDYMVRLIHEWQHEGLSIGSTKWQNSKRTFKELGFFIEALRALVLKEFNLKHPMQDVVKDMMKIMKDPKTNKYFSQIQYPKIEKTVEFEGDDLK